MVQVQVHVVLLRPDAAPFAHLDGDRPADHVPRRQVLCVRSVALHEPLPFGVQQETALAADPLGNQHARAVDAGGVELHELHVLQGQSGPQDHGVAVAGADVRGCAGEVGASVTAGGEDDHAAVEPVQAALGQVDGHDAAADALLHDQVHGKELDEELRVVLKGLLIQGVQHGVPGPVRGRAGALGDAFAVVGGHPAETRAGRCARLRCGKRARRSVPVR